MTGRWRYRTERNTGTVMVAEHLPDGRLRGTYSEDGGVHGTVEGRVTGSRVVVTSITKVLFLKARCDFDGTLSIVGGRPTITGTYTGDASGTGTMTRED